MLYASFVPLDPTRAVHFRKLDHRPGNLSGRSLGEGGEAEVLSPSWPVTVDDDDDDDDSSTPISVD